MAAEGISDPILNCITEVCCGRQEAQAVMSATLIDQGICEDKAHADKCALWLYENFDMMPAGTTGKMKKALAKLARGRSGSVLGDGQ